jgi:hypothetical protein
MTKSQQCTDLVPLYVKGLGLFAVECASPLFAVKTSDAVKLSSCDRAFGWEGGVLVVVLVGG